MRQEDQTIKRREATQKRGHGLARGSMSNGPDLSPSDLLVPPLRLLALRASRIGEHLHRFRLHAVASLGAHQGGERAAARVATRVGHGVGGQIHVLRRRTRGAPCPQRDARDGGRLRRELRASLDPRDDGAAGRARRRSRRDPARGRSRSGRGRRPSRRSALVSTRMARTARAVEPMPGQASSASCV